MWGIAGMYGWRASMEDAHVAEEVTLPNGDKGAVFCVFDGHGGDAVAEFAKKNFMDVLTSQAEYQKEEYEEALTKTFLELDEKLRVCEDWLPSGRPLSDKVEE